MPIILVHLVLAVSLAALFAGLLYFVFERRGPGPYSGLAFFFVLLFLIIWAAGIWFSPRSGAEAPLSYLPFVITGLVAVLVLGAATPRTRQPPAEERKESAEALAVGLGIFFWLTVLVLMGAILLHYARPLVVPEVPPATSP